MKDMLIAPRIDRPTLSITFDELPFVCLLVLASLLALSGGIATSILFFGLLLSFSLLLLGSRHFSTRRRLAVDTLAAK